MEKFDYKEIEELNESDKDHVSRIPEENRQSIDGILRFTSGTKHQCGSCRTIFEKLTEKNPNIRMIY